MAQGSRPSKQGSTSHGTQFSENQQIAQAMRGVDFPARREDIVQHAQQNNAPQTVIRQLNELPNEEFENVAQVMEAVGAR